MGRNVRFPIADCRLRSWIKFILRARAVALDVQ